MILRHKDSNLSSMTAGKLHSKASIINVYDGTNQHPTQALLDYLLLNKQSLASISYPLLS